MGLGMMLIGDAQGKELIYLPDCPQLRTQENP